MSAFAEIIGQQAALALLERMLDSGRVPHAMLFHGPESVGKATTARIFATALLCEQGTACGACGSCALVARDAHPDLLTVRRLPKPAGPADELSSFIVVEQIREVSRLAGLTPRAGTRRVFVIDPADRMHAESQNALLKTLEEPPGSAVLILVASRPHLLLPTVRSRSVGIAFAPVRTSELARRLAAGGMPAAEARARAALAGGRPGAALAVELEALRERRERLVALLESLVDERPAIAQLPAGAAALAGKDEATLLDSLEMLEGLLRDAARAGIGGEHALLHADLDARLARLGGRLGAARAAALVESVERLRGYLRFNTNRVLIAESLLAAVAGGPIP